MRGMPSSARRATLPPLTTVQVVHNAAAAAKALSRVVWLNFTPISCMRCKRRVAL